MDIKSRVIRVIPNVRTPNAIVGFSGGQFQGVLVVGITDDFPVDQVFGVGDMKGRLSAKGRPDRIEILSHSYDTKVTPVSRNDRIVIS